MQTLIKFTISSFVLAVWFVPPALTKLRLPYPKKRSASLGMLLVGYVTLIATGWLRYGWETDLFALFLGASVYCGTALLFTLGFLGKPGDE